jgi:hypothetical protein
VHVARHQLDMEAESEMLNPAGQKLSRAGFVKISLKNHLCLLALRKGCGFNFHLGTIVRTVFESFFLAQNGYGTQDLSIYQNVGEQLGDIAEATMQGTLRTLNAQAGRAIGELLAVYDRQLESAPIGQLVSAHERAEENFNASPDERKSINTLVTMEQVRRMYENERGVSAEAGLYPLS